MTAPDRVLQTLRWLAGPQGFADSPDSRDLGEVRRLGLARDVDGRVELTDAGRARLAELTREVAERCEGEAITYSKSSG